MKKYSLLIFDWDGTILDSLGCMTECMRNISEELNQPMPSIEAIRKATGLKTEIMGKELFPHLAAEDYVTAFYKHFTEDKMENNFFPKTIETLRQLKSDGYLLALATNKSRAPLEHALMRNKIADIFDATRCPEDGQPKPHPWMLLDLLNKFCLSFDEAVMIGDTIYDLETAKNAGIDAFAATYGYHSKALLAAYKPKAFVAAISDIPRILKF